MHILNVIMKVSCKHSIVTTYFVVYLQYLNINIIYMLIDLNLLAFCFCHIRTNLMYYKADYPYRRNT